MLRMGDRGDDVRALQRMLQPYAPGLSTDGVFGPRTDRAVRLSQRREGLYPPDGIAGPLTMAALRHLTAGSRPVEGPTRSVPTPAQRSPAFAAASRSIAPPPTRAAPVVPPSKGDPGPLRAAVQTARQRAQTAAMPEGVASPVASLRTSRPLRRFIIAHETQAGVSNRLHHPSMGSGVTIGPGYDMKDRSRDEVMRHLMAVRVSAEAASQAAAGAGLSGQKARNFVRDNKAVVDLSDAQQSELLLQVIGHYEAKVKRAIKVPLLQQEYDALVSYAYNPGGGWTKTTALVNAGNPHEAMVEIKRHVYSKGELIRSLVRRREAESRMFLYGEYH